MILPLIVNSFGSRQSLHLFSQPHTRSSPLPIYSAYKRRSFADAEEDSGSEDGQDDPRSSSSLRGSSSDAMSKSHQTGLAKLPHGLEWLMNAIGGARRGNIGANPSADDAEPTPKFLIFAHHKYEQRQSMLSLYSNILRKRQIKVMASGGIRSASVLRSRQRPLQVLPPVW